MAKMNKRKALVKALGDMGTRDYSSVKEMESAKGLYDMLTSSQASEPEPVVQPRKRRSGKTTEVEQTQD